MDPSTATLRLELNEKLGSLHILLSEVTKALTEENFRLSQAETAWADSQETLDENHRLQAEIRARIESLNSDLCQIRAEIARVLTKQREVANVSATVSVSV